MSLLELLQQMRKAARSRDLVERLRTLWIGGLLGERLERCSDHEVGDLLSSVQDGLGIFSPDFAICEHAKQRLLRSKLKTGQSNWQLVRDEGIELLKTEAVLFRFGFPHLLLPFQRDRFASRSFLVPNADDAKECLLRTGFLNMPNDEAVLVDPHTNRSIRLVDGAQEN